MSTAFAAGTTIGPVTQACDQQEINHLKRIIHDDRDGPTGRVDRQQFRMVHWDRAAVREVYIERLKRRGPVEFSNPIDCH